jgi:hypothetical protein
MQKCNYYNDAQAACTLMIDDLVEVAITTNGVVTPQNDWGYGLSSTNSLWNYFENNFLQKYPEAKGTIFYSTEHSSQNINAGYIIKKRKIDESFKSFIQYVKSSFDLAFHGTTHGKYLDPYNPEKVENFLQEFEYVTRNDISFINEKIERMELLLDIHFNGGKYCGYKKNQHADKVIEELGFKWWASSSDMINKKHLHNKHFYWGENQKVLEFPTKVSGNLFNRQLRGTKGRFPLLRNLKTFIGQFAKENYLQYLYENRLIISIQEHFQNQRTDGKRQTPNVYDDIYSLDRIYSLLRGTDTWHATCSEIAHYLESYDNTMIESMDSGEYRISYSGRWGKPFLTIKSSQRVLENTKTKENHYGYYKNGMWMFNDLEDGIIYHEK